MRSIALVVLVLLVGGPSGALEKILKDPDGTVLGVVLDCSSCKDSKNPAKCEDGIEDGFRAGAACGKCLLESNFGAGIASHYDVRISGRLVDEAGKPIGMKFVQMRMANTWGVKARTADDGAFMIRLGATRAKKGTTPATLELGDLKWNKDGKIPLYTIYLLPQNHKPCGDKDTKKDSKKD